MSAVIIFGGLTVSGIRRSGKEGTLGLFLSISLVTTGLVTLAALLNIKVFNARYLFCFFPVYIAVLAMGVPSARIPRFIALFTAILIMIISTWNYFTVAKYARDDMRSAAARVFGEERTGDLILVPCGASVFNYYYEGNNTVEEYSPRFLGEEETVRRLEGQLGDHQRIWYVECRPWDVDPDGIIPETLRLNTEPLGQYTFPGIVLTLHSPSTLPPAPPIRSGE